MNFTQKDRYDLIQCIETNTLAPLTKMVREKGDAPSARGSSLSGWEFFLKNWLRVL